MDIPGLAGALEDPRLREKAEQESERLLEALKKSVRAELKDVGVLRKHMTVTVPAQVIADHLAHNYDSLMHDAFVPGFRRGRAPRRLVEKRFGSEVRDSLKTSILGQSFFAAIENEKLDVLGDPRFQIHSDQGDKLMELDEALPHIALPEEGDFSYACEIELKPKFELPELKGIEIRTADITITEALVDEQILRQRKIRGRFEPITDGAAVADDLLVADVVLSAEGAEVKREENVQLGVRPTRLDGVQLLNLTEALVGVRAGETRGTDCTIPDDYERTDLRGKPGRFEFKVHEIKRLVPASLDDYLKAMGFEGESELREHVQDQLELERDRLVMANEKLQIEEYLLSRVALELPEELSARQTDRAVLRRVVELQQRGVPLSDIEQRIDELRTSAKEQVTRELKLAFIMEDVAKQLEVSVTDEEVNSEIARIARLYNRRFDRVRDDLQKQGLLAQLAEQIRHDKCVAVLRADAQRVAAAAAAAAPKEIEST